MSYSIIQVPFSVNLRDMPKDELNRYFQWFLAVIPERVRELTAAVKETPGFEPWQPDCTPTSLDALGQWFAGQVETRSRTQSEIDKLQTERFPIVNEELTNRTLSMGMDVGMYFSQVLTKNHPSLGWVQPSANKKFIDYGQPSLTGFRTMTLNPVAIAVTLAYGIARKTKTGRRLREVYDYWERQVKNAE